MGNERLQYNCLNPIAQIGLDKLPVDSKEVPIEEASCLLVRSCDMHKLQLSDKVICVARAGAGTNNIPIDDLAQKGIVVFNTPGANANGVKELAITAMLLASRDIIDGVNWANNCNDTRELPSLVEKNKKAFAGHEIMDKTLGVIGLGAIGALVANAGLDLGMNVIGFDPYISVDTAWKMSQNVKRAKSLEELLQVSDYITIHVPLGENTKGFLNKELLSIVKKGASVINLSRDSLVDEIFMLELLDNGHIHRYITDFPNETVIGKKGVIAIPHLGASTEESEDRCAIMAVKEIVDFFENGNIKNSVNYPDCSMGILNKGTRLCIAHYNKKSVIARMTTIFGNSDINIIEMTNKSKGEYAYSIFDIEGQLNKTILDEIHRLPEVLRARCIIK